MVAFGCPCFPSDLSDFGGLPWGPSSCPDYPWVRLCFVVLLRVLGGASVFLLILPGQAVASLDCSALAVPHGDLGCRDG